MGAERNLGEQHRGVDTVVLATDPLSRVHSRVHIEPYVRPERQGWERSPDG